jgi:hypothetical protein
MTPTPATADSLTWLLWPVAAMMACGLAVFLLAGRLPAKALACLGQLTVLTGFLVFFVALVPRAGSTAWLSVPVLLATLALFKLLNRFESPR